MYPVKIKRPDARLAKIIMEQYGGPECVYYKGRVEHSKGLTVDG